MKLPSRAAYLALASVLAGCSTSYTDASDDGGVTCSSSLPPDPWEACSHPDEVQVDLSVECNTFSLPLRGDGSLGCELTIAATPDACCELDGRIVTVNGQERCQLRQLVPSTRAPSSPPPSGTGWYYDDFSPEWSERGCSGGIFRVTRALAPDAEPRVRCCP